MAALPSMQLYVKAAAFSNNGPQYQSNRSRALNAKISPRPQLMQVRPNASAGFQGSPASNMLQICALGGYDRHFSPRGGLRPEPGQHTWLRYPPGTPQYGVPVLAKQPKGFQLQVKSGKFVARVEEEGNNYFKPNSISPEEQLDPDDNLKRIERKFGEAKQAFVKGRENSFPFYTKAAFFIPTRYFKHKIRRMQEKDILDYLIKSGVTIAGVVLSKMSEAVLDIAKHIPDVQIEDRLKFESSLVPRRPDSDSETPHAKPPVMTVLPDHAQRATKEELSPGMSVVFRDNQGLFRVGIWDGDILVRDVTSCTCSNCTAAAAFNRKYAPEFTKGDHLYAECEPNSLTNEPMFHQGIYDGAGYVYHFATNHADVDKAYEKCAECRARGAQRRKNLVSRNLSPSGIRKSCLYCFAEKECMDSRRDNIDKYISQIKYGMDFKEWKMASTNIPLSPIVCMEARREDEDVVKDAREFYDNNSFGSYSEKQGGMSHNCESFAYLCKTGFYESHQVTEELFRQMLIDKVISSDNDRFLFLLGAKAFLFVRGGQKVAMAREKAKKMNEERPMLVPAVALVPDEMWIVRDE